MAVNKACYVKSLKHDYKQLGIAAGIILIILVLIYTAFVVRITPNTGLVYGLVAAGIIITAAINYIMTYEMDASDVRMHSYGTMASVYAIAPWVSWVIVVCISAVFCNIPNSGYDSAFLGLITIASLAGSIAGVAVLPLIRATALCTEDEPAGATG